jgi:cytochrome c biogenesis protein CcmG/thiol:disulfide interchange protein DsbE
MPEQKTIADSILARAMTPGDGVVRRRLLLALPAVGFVGLAGLLASGLGRDASLLPSTLIGREAPKFDLPPVQGRVLGLANTDLLEKVSLVNVFASWCVACRAEHPLLMQLARDKTVPVYGLNYKDAPHDAARWLNTMGDPYTRTGADRDGRVAIDWGVYGVPETFVVGTGGIIAYKQIGALTQEALAGTILPLVARLRQEAERQQS